MWHFRLWVNSAWDVNITREAKKLRLRTTVTSGFQVKKIPHTLYLSSWNIVNLSTWLYIICVGWKHNCSWTIIGCSCCLLFICIIPFLWILTGPGWVCNFFIIYVIFMSSHLGGTAEKGTLKILIFPKLIEDITLWFNCFSCSGRFCWSAASPRWSRFAKSPSTSHLKGLLARSANGCILGKGKINLAAAILYQGAAWSRHARILPIVQNSNLKQMHPRFPKSIHLRKIARSA